MPAVSPRWKIQSSRMDGDRPLGYRPLVSRKPGKLAILLSLRHDSPSLDVSSTNRQRPAKNNCQRNLAFRRLRCNQRNRHVAISLDRPNPTAIALCRKKARVKKFRVATVLNSLSDSPDRVRLPAVCDQKALPPCLTAQITR